MATNEIAQGDGQGRRGTRRLRGAAENQEGARDWLSVGPHQAEEELESRAIRELVKGEQAAEPLAQRHGCECSQPMLEHDPGYVAELRIIGGRCSRSGDKLLPNAGERPCACEKEPRAAARDVSLYDLPRRREELHELWSGWTNRYGTPSRCAMQPVRAMETGQPTPAARRHRRRSMATSDRRFYFPRCFPARPFLPEAPSRSRPTRWSTS